MATIRPYRTSDLEAISEVCVRTGHAGHDARPYYRDGDLLPDVFVRPYLESDADLAFVADDGGTAVGYIVGTASTPDFVSWFREVWLARMADRHPMPLAADQPAVPPAVGRHGVPRVARDAEDQPVDWHEVMTRALYNPERMLKPALVSYPAHWHMNLLPECQRQGLGRRLMSRFLAELHSRGVAALHGAHGKYNISARVFYKRLGFVRLAVDDPDPIIYIGRDVPAAGVI